MPAIDGLRFLAAAAVLLYHFTASAASSRYWPEPAAAMFPTINSFTRYGWLAVDAFFVISGLVIVRSARNGQLRRFVASRVSRLLPAYWASVVITAALRVAWGDRSPAVGDAFANLTMVQGEFGVPNLQVVYWTLLVELKFYVIVGILVWKRHVDAKGLYVLSVAWPISAVVAEVASRSLPAGLAASSFAFAGHHLEARFAPFFAIGILIHLSGVPSWRRLTWAPLLFNAGLAVRSVVLASAGTQRLLDVPIRADVAVGLTVGACAVIAVAAKVRIPSRPARALAVAGALTYPLYLVHVEFGNFVIDRVSGTLSAPATVLVAMTVCLALAVVINVVIERRTSRRLRSILEGGAVRRSRSAGPESRPEGALPLGRRTARARHRTPGPG